MNYGQGITEKFQREKLAELLNQCTNKQRELFYKLYPDGPKASQLNWCLTQAYNSAAIAKGEKYE